jgi:pimeloyl-ACP methyl ester carboxylesterase
LNPPAVAAPVLLIHGQPGSVRDWQLVQAAIGERAQTIAFNRPGWDRRSPPVDLTGNARAAVCVLDGAGVERATVVGHSFGGAVAAWLAVNHPERVGALVLVAPSASFASLNRLDRVLGAPLVGPVLGAAAMAGAGAALAVQPARARIGAQLALQTPYLQMVARGFLTPATWRSFAAEQRMLIRELPVLERRLREIAAPTTIVVGTADRVVSPSSAQQLAIDIPGAELVLIERAAHLLPQQKPSELAEVILGAAE